MAIAAASEERVSTGIKMLDEYLKGGFPRPSTLLLFSEKPTEKRLFAENFAALGAKAGQDVLYVDFYRDPGLARRELGRFGRIPEEHLVFVDAVSSQLLKSSDERYRIERMGSLRSIVDTVVRAIEEVRPARVIVDSMEYLADRFPPEGLLEGWRRIIEAVRSVRGVACFLFMNWTYAEEEVEDLRELTDYLVEFQSSMRGGIVRSSMRLTQTAKDGVRTNWIPYAFRDLVGVQVYFPRILVTGPFNAGKSTVVRALSERSVSVDRMGTTVAFDYGNVDLMGIQADLLGTPGQERFEFIFQIFAREVTGVLLVVDASRPEDFERAQHMLELVGPRIPYVVLANKSDLPGAMSPAEIAARMKLPEGTPVVTTVATEKRGVRDALLILAEMIIGVR